MNYYRINNITGWILCLFACSVYIITSEAGGSFWDCGEFISSCYKLQIPHSPGAPLFVLLGRIFIVLFGNDPLTAARAVNIMSALASGFTILFLFWTTTHFAKKLVHKNGAPALTVSQVTGIMAAGVVAALAGTFTDSFWYSAVEGEVYALSSFFTAIVFWAALKWEAAADSAGGDRWLVFIFFMIGLSIGVHLLCLLCVPAIIVLWYCKRRHSLPYATIRRYFVRLVVVGGIAGFVVALVAAQATADAQRGIPADNTVAGLVLLAAVMAIALLLLAERFKPSQKQLYGGVYIFTVLGVVVFGIILKGVIQYSVKAAGAFDIFFVNSLSLPFFSGFACFFILVAAAIWAGIRYAARRNFVKLRLALWCIAFTLIGYSTYLTTMIRSNANPSIDMFNVDNPLALEGYLGRDQYGDFPLLYGQNFTAQPVDYADEGPRYARGDHQYVPNGNDVGYVFLPKDKMVFPRMWDMSDDQGHADYYALFSGIRKTAEGHYERSPGFSDNLHFFLSYQTYFMYIRYFFWNFSGRQNDVQGVFPGNVRDGNWITGIPVVDNALYGNQQLMPDSLQHSKGHNTMFMLPFVFGLIGLLYQLKKRGSDAFITTLLFLSTGMAIVVYINQPGYQPRERDYAYVGSFYVFAIWIGLSVLYFMEQAAAWNKSLLKSLLINTACISVLLLVFVSIAGYTGGAAATVGIACFILTATLAAGIPIMLRSVKRRLVIAAAAGMIALGIPLLMAVQQWDDHDRSKKQLARDTARNYLESCAPNAILFSIGDNDTYPLWFAQEVEGIRPDVRIIITTLIGTDWKINELRRKVNNSDPVDVIWTAEQVQGNKRDYVFYQPQPQFPDNRYYDLYEMMKHWVGSNDPATMVASSSGEMVNTFPVRKLAIPVDTNLVKANGTVTPQDEVLDALRFELPATNVLLKNDLAILNIIAANRWQRPVYFTMPYNKLGFDKYLRRDGMAYRLVPVADPPPDTAKMYNLVMRSGQWSYGNTHLPAVYLDEINRSQLLGIRNAELDLVNALIAGNKLAEARNVLRHNAAGIRESNLPYGFTSGNNMHNRISLAMLDACYRAGDTQLAAAIKASVQTDLQQQQRYYDALNPQQQATLEQERLMNDNLLQALSSMIQHYVVRKTGLE